MDKKAIIFTFIVVALLSVVIIAFLINVGNRGAQAKIQDTNIKIETLNSFAKTLNQQLLPQALKASSNRAIIAWLMYLDTANNESKTLVPLTGEFITKTPDLNTNLKNAIIYENYKKIVGPSEITLPLTFMVPAPDENYTLTSIFKEIEVLANNSGLIFNYTYPGDYTYTIEQISPWEINVSMIIQDYWVYDNKKTTFFHFSNMPFSTILNITNYDEPFMLVLDNRSVTINATGFTSGPTGDFTDPIKFQAFYRRPEFIAHGDAPTFLKRLQGDPASDVNGIETVLDPLYFPNPNRYSNVDYLYWKKDNTNVCSTDVSGIYLDNIPPNSHLNFYGRVCFGFGET